MAHPAPISSPRFRLPSGSLAIAASLIVLATAILAVRSPFRTQLRQQLAHRDARVLTTLVQRQLDEPGHGSIASDPLAAILAASFVPELPGLVAVRLYSPEGHLFATLLGDTAANLPLPSPLPTASQPEPIVHFVGLPAPRLRVWMPLHPPGSTLTSGIAFLELDAQDLAREYQILDARLQRDALIAFLVLGTVLGSLLALAFHRLERAHRLLAQNVARLENANRELALAAKTSAVGTVASHLIHGLRNPLAALQQAVASNADPAEATQTARRMRAMIDDVVRVLRDEQGLTAYEIPADELLAEVIRKCTPPAPLGSRIAWSTHVRTGPSIDNRNANLTLLILENLCTNAIQAMQGNGSIRLEAEHRDGHWLFSIEDSGPGIPADQLPHLFAPQTSSKPGGSGLGLALSHQLARHLDGELSLVSSQPGLTRFLLSIPTR